MNKSKFGGLALILVAAIAYFANEGQLTATAGGASNAGVWTAFADRASDTMVRGEGIVKTVLADDTKGSRHQRFILDVGRGHTILIAHNIDLAPRIDGLSVGDSVSYVGEYEWNDKGGVVHWTHHDPAGRHPGGYLIHAGIKYE